MAAAGPYTLTAENIETLEIAAGPGTYNFHIQDMNKDAFASPNIKTIRTYNTITKNESGLKTYIGALLRNKHKGGGFYTHKLMKGGVKLAQDYIKELKQYKPNIKIKEVQRQGKPYYEISLLNDKKLIRNSLYETCLHALFKDIYVKEATGNLHQIEQMERNIQTTPPHSLVEVNINSLYFYDDPNHGRLTYVPHEIAYMIRDSGSTEYARAPNVFPRNDVAAAAGPRDHGDQSLTFLFVPSDATDPAGRQNFNGDENAMFFPPDDQVLTVNDGVLDKLGCKPRIITGYNIRRNNNRYIVEYTITYKGQTQINMNVSCENRGYVRSGNGSQFFTGNPEKNSWFAANHNKVTPANVRAGIAYLVSKEFWGDCHIVEVAKLYQLRGNIDNAGNLAPAAIFTDDNALTAFALKNSVNCVTKQRNGGTIKSVLRYHTGPIAGGGDGISPNLEKSSMKYNYYSFIVINNNHKVIELIETLPEKDRDPLLIDKIKKLSIWVGSQTNEERIKDCSVINMIIHGQQSGHIANPFQFVPEDVVREIGEKTLDEFQGPPYEDYDRLIWRYSIKTHSTKSVQAIYDPKPVTTTSLLKDIIKEYYVDEDAKHQDILQLEIDDIYNYLYYIFNTLDTVTLVPNKVYLIMHDIIKDKKIQSMNKDSLVNYYNTKVKPHSGSRKRIRFGQTHRRHKRTTQRRSGRRYIHSETRRQSRSRSLQVSPPKQSGQPEGSPGSLQVSPIIRNNGFVPISNNIPVSSSPNATPGNTLSAPPPSAPQLRTQGFRPTSRRPQILSPVPKESQATT